ncbi:MAG: T9SS type A sorting domain-containing protein [Flavobacteriales bacterium]
MNTIKIIKMKRHILLPLLALATFASVAQLAPQQPATLLQHMIEVNAEWKTTDAAIPKIDTPVSFANEAERIAMHLHLVRETLSIRSCEGLSVEATANRKTLLEALGNYADRGRFPQNTILPFRNPIFIDPNGTACAVGQLMIESGSLDLAQRIDTEMETAYVREMHWPEINEWAGTNGFSADELAWIQPGYAPPIPWSTLGNGINGSVTVLRTLGNGELLVAGNFTNAGGIPCTNVARWNGAYYTDMGTPMDGMITAAIEYNGDIYIGGSFNGGTSDLQRWNNGSWEAQAAFSSKYAQINAMHVHNGELYIAGSMSGFAGIDDLVLRKNGNLWEQVGEVFNETIFCLASLDGELVAGGLFDGIVSTMNPAVAHVAVLSNNSWTQLGDGLDAPVRALMNTNGTLYAGGDLFANVVPVFGLARIGGNDTSWEMLMPNKVDYIFPNQGPAFIGSLALYQDKVYAAGDFNYSSGGIGLYSHNLVQFNGTPDDVSAMIGWLDGTINTLAVNSASLLIGGEFTTPYAHIASTELNTGINDELELTSLTISPNPSAEIITIQVPTGMTTNAVFRVTDASGKIALVEPDRNSNSYLLNVGPLATGSYQIDISEGDTRASGRFIKQ